MPQTFRQPMPRNARFELAPQFRAGAIDPACDFSRAFVLAAKAWPGTELGYVGSAVDKKRDVMVHYFQLRGVSDDFAVVL